MRPLKFIVVLTLMAIAANAQGKLLVIKSTVAAIDRMMTERRGFPQFAAFDKFLVDSYRNRQPGRTVADLYPQIIEWFEKNN